MVEPWPFGAADWERVRELCLAGLNATLAGDGVLRASVGEELRQVLAELHGVYGGHPILWETEADYAADPAEGRRLYEEATRAAVVWGSPTVSIRISFAGLLLDEFADPAGALAELTACEPELADHADDREREQWAELAARCRAG